MAQLSEEIVGKLIAMAESFQDVKQQVQQSAQDASQAVQTAKDTAQAIGQLQSDLATRLIDKDIIDVGQDEQMKATAGRDVAAWAYKTNVSDFLAGTNNVTNQGNVQGFIQQMIQASVNHYQATLGINERYHSAKWQQELRHSDIATENQWESTQESANDALAAELAKSTQVPKAAVEK